MAGSRSQASCPALDPVSAAGRGAAEDELADSPGHARGDDLGGASAHRSAVDVGRGHAERIEHGERVLREDLGAVRRLRLVARSGAAIVEGDRGADALEVLTYAVPPVVVVGLAGEQQQRRPRALDLVGDAGAVGGLGPSGAG